MIRAKRIVKNRDNFIVKNERNEKNIKYWHKMRNGSKKA